MESATPETPKSLRTEFKPREFLLGLLVAALIVLAVAGSRWYVRARTAPPPTTQTNTPAIP